MKASSEPCWNRKHRSVASDKQTISHLLRYSSLQTIQNGSPAKRWLSQVVCVNECLTTTLLKENTMPYVTVGKENGANIDIYYKDWGKGQPIVFSHGWPLSADDWDPQMLFFLSKGYRVIAVDRRGHGRPTQTDSGHDMEHYADDLKAVTDQLNLKDAIHVGHSTGGRQVVHYLGRHGDKSVAKAAIISAVPPLMGKT